MDVFACASSMYSWIFPKEMHEYYLYSSVWFYSIAHSLCEHKYAQCCKWISETIVAEVFQSWKNPLLCLLNQCQIMKGHKKRLLWRNRCILYRSLFFFFFFLSLLIRSSVFRCVSNINPNEQTPGYSRCWRFSVQIPSKTQNMDGKIHKAPGSQSSGKHSHLFSTS